MQPIEPTPTQIENCRLSGWHLLDEYTFTNGELLGHFTEEGFVKYI